MIDSVLSMETQASMEMAHGEIHGKRALEEITEEKFLKDIYLFMRMRDTPIERIPHLGFKQIDLFVMFKTVSDMGGYHLVTAQQLWKQVYNRLGGNPRSTSAATCTRRHYEKLLLPYECYKKGILMNALPEHQSKLLHDVNYNKEDEDGQRPAKRKLLSARQHQSVCNLQSDPRGNNFPLPLPYTHYYHPSHAAPPPYVSIPSSVLTSQSPPSTESQFSFHPTHPNTTDRVKEPLEHLRDLAEQYKTSSGLVEPLNLSIKAQSQEADRNPTSSFAPPSSGKNPKFLNKPSPMYTPHRPPLLRSDGCETQDGKADVTSYSYPAKEGDAYVIDVTSSGHNSPEPTPTMRTDKAATSMAQTSSSPKRDFTIRQKEAREGSPETQGLNVSYTQPSPPQDNGGKMEIQIPLSLFHSWLRQCGSSAMIHGVKQPHTLPALEEHSAQRNGSHTDILPTNLSLHMDPQHWSPAAEDLRLRRVPSPTPTTQTTENHHHTSQNHFTSYKPLPSGGILKSVSSRNVYPVDQQDVIQSYGSKASNSWGAYDKETLTYHNRVKTVSSPPTVPRDFRVNKSHYEDAPRGGKDSSEMGPPSTVLMLNSNSASMLHLTTEEVMKLKKIISSLQ